EQAWYRLQSKLPTGMTTNSQALEFIAVGPIGVDRGEIGFLKPLKCRRGVGAEGFWRVVYV
ncbi:hypothetical protein AVEN_157495-1, partial [Araneus ventricosus]